MTNPSYFKTSQNQNTNNDKKGYFGGYTGGYTYSRYNTSTTANTLNCIALPNPNTDTVSRIEFSSQGDPMIAASGWDQTIRLWKFDDWDYKSATFSTSTSDPSHNAIIRFCFNSDCTHIYFGTTGGDLYDWDLDKALQASSTTATSAFGGGKFSFKPSTTTTTTAGAKGGFPQASGGFGSTKQNMPLSFSNLGNTTKTSTTGYSFGSTANQNPQKINLLIQDTNTPMFADCLITGLKFNDDLQLVICAYSTDGTETNNFPHSGIFLLSPAENKIVRQSSIFANIKIIDMDSVGNEIYLACLSDGKSFVARIKDLASALNTGAFAPEPIPQNDTYSSINSMITSIASIPQGYVEGGYFASTIQGFVEMLEYQENNQVQKLNCGIFREEANNKFETYPANCVAVCHEEKRAAIACGRNQMALFNTENGLYKIYTPTSTKEKGLLKGSITACAVSRSGDAYAVAFGYDWSEGADGMTRYVKERGTPQILVGQLPDPPENEN